MPTDESHGCATQMDVDEGVHGALNPVAFGFDQTTGYLPVAANAFQSAPSSDLQDGWNPKTDCTSLESFLKCVSAARLNRMPHRASKWDRFIRVLEGVLACPCD